MKKFRGKEVVGWRILTHPTAQGLENKINLLMEEYEFEDFQYSISEYSSNNTYSCAVLLSKKGE